MVKGKKKEHGDEKDTLHLEAEPDREYDDYINDQPAYLLAKVDGDELAHLLDSEHATPFDTPRLEDAADVTPTKLEYQEDEEKPTHNIKKPLTQFDPDLLVPGEADPNTQINAQGTGGLLEAQRSNTSLTQAAHRHKVDLADAHLEGEWQADNEYQWSIAHARILYLISVFALESPFAHEDEREPWIKELHLMVFLYEAIKNSLLPFNTCPQCMLAVDHHGKTQKIWINSPTESVGFINDLCKRGFIHILRIMTQDGWAENAYRCSKAGLEFLRRMPQKPKTQIDSVIKDPIESSPFNVVIDRSYIFLQSDSGFERQSTVTDIGRIPYVVSPYMAMSIRHIDSLLTDNAHLAYQCVLWETEVPDDRDEALVLGNVSITLLECIFTGSNSIGLMVEALEGSAYSQTARSCVTFTSKQVNGPISTRLMRKFDDANEKKTRSMLIDFSGNDSLNFEAEILVNIDDLPVKRVQQFGVHIHQNGVVMCGVLIEAMQDREWDDIAPNLLGGLLVELHRDSSVIIDPMLSKLQRDILRSLYDGNHMSRSKTLCIIADKIEPVMKASEYMDGGRYQKEFVQLIGEIHTCRDLGDEDTIFIGNEGVMLVGPKARNFEKLVIKYLSLMVIDHAIQRLYARLRTVNNTLIKCHHIILERRAETVGRLNPRDIINAAGVDLMLLWTMMQHIIRAIEDYQLVDRPTEALQQRLWEMLELASYKGQIVYRSKDLQRLFLRTQNEVRALTDIADVEDRIDLEEVFHSVDKTTGSLASPVQGLLNHTGEVHMRSEVPLRIVTCCFGGFLVRDIVHRLHIGMETGAPTPTWFSGPMAGINDTPMLMFCFSVAILLAGCSLILWYAGHIQRASMVLLWRSVTLNIPIIDFKKFVKLIHNNG